MAKFKKPSDIKAGVIGYGGAFNMGRRHLADMKQAGAVPTAVAEIDPERRKVAAEEYPGIEVYSSAAEMLKKSDANLIAVITPHNTHAKLAVQCLRAGRHVVCEKPLAITTAECDRMIRTAKEKKLVISTYHNRHWDGCILEAVDQILNKKVIGDVFRIEAHMGGYGMPGEWWRSSKSISGGILYDWGVHLLEYSLQIMNAEIAEVSGYAKTGIWAAKHKFKKDVNEDEAHAVVRFTDGRWLTLTLTTVDSFPKSEDRYQLEVTGSEGTYMFNGNEYETRTHDKKGVKVVRKGKNRAGEQQKFYQNVVDHLVKDEELVITPEWSRRPIHILDLASRSATQNKAIKAKHK